MAMKRTNILIMGLARSGSHALVDLLSEYDNVAVFPREFDDFRAPGLVADQLDENLRDDYPNLIHLKTSSRKYKSNLGVAFLPKNIQKMPWLYKHLQKRSKIDRRIKNILYRHSLTRLNHALKSDLTLPEKIIQANQWVQRVGEIYAENEATKEYVVFDQPITSLTNPDIWPEVFAPFKLMCSIRNPKDQIANLVKDRYLYLPYGAPFMTWGGFVLEGLYGRDRKDALQMFITFIENIYKRLHALSARLGPEQFMVVNFENLVTGYDENKQKIEKFVGGINGHHIKPKKYFDPDVSIQNVNYYNTYLSSDEIKRVNALEVSYHKFLSKHSD